MWTKKFVKFFLQWKLVCYLWIKYLLNKIDQTEVAVLESLYCKWCILNANKIDVVACFSKVTCQFLLVCLIIYVSKFSDKTDKFLLNYSKLRRGLVFIRTVYITYVQLSGQINGKGTFWTNFEETRNLGELPSDTARNIWFRSDDVGGGLDEYSVCYSKVSCTVFWFLRHASKSDRSRIPVETTQVYRVC